MNSDNFIKKVHLIISLIIAIPASLIYGFKPSFQFDVYLNTIDELNVFKAMMGLYLGFSFLWVLGLLKRNYLFAALVSNVIFMLGLGFGRLISFVLDGIPTFPLIFGTFGELFIGFYGLWVLKRHK